MAKLSELFTSENKQTTDPALKNITVKKIHYKNLVSNIAQYRDELKDDNLLPIAASIQSVGVLQPLIVTPSKQDGLFDIVAGHTRVAAVKYLVEEQGLSGAIEYLPCEIKNYDSDEKEELELLSSNFHSTESPQELSRRINRLYDIYDCHPEYLNGSSLRQTLQDTLGLSRSSVGEFITLKNNLGTKATELFNAGEISKSTAIKLSALSLEQQEEVIEQHKDDKLKLDDVNTYTKDSKQKRAAKATRPASPAQSSEQSNDDYFIKDLSLGSAELLVEKYTAYLEKNQDGSPSLVNELMLIITALNFYIQNHRK